MAGTKVIIAGGGVAGPVLAILLKLRGYDPIIYERLDAPTDMGLSLALQANGLKVLGLIPGLVDKIPSHEVSSIVQYSALAEDERELVRLRTPQKELTGYGVHGVRRPAFLRALIDEAQARGVPVVFGHQLVGFEQHAESVTVRFANGKTDTGSFVVGCDGLHSNTRTTLFGEEAVSFTGLTQTGGISPYPEAFKTNGETAMFNIYGDGVHMIGYPVSDHEISWAITRRKGEAKETWRAMDEEARKSSKKALIPVCPSVAGGSLEWQCESSRCPPIPILDPFCAWPFTALLETIFTEFDGPRIARTSELIKGARQQDEQRVVNVVEAWKKRNQVIAEMYSGSGGLVAQFLRPVENPFKEGESEI